MYSALIVSDSHGLTKELEQIKSRHQIDCMIHCGDSELEPNDQVMCGFYKVRGNCDYDDRYPLEESFTIGGKMFFVAHGHLLDVKMNLTKIGYRGEELGADVICFGHTHVAGVHVLGKQIFINPGSIRQPKSRPEKTYALMQWDGLRSVNVIFYTVDGKKVEELSRHITL